MARWSVVGPRRRGSTEKIVIVDTGCGWLGASTTSAGALLIYVARVDSEWNVLLLAGLLLHLLIG